MYFFFFFPVANKHGFEGEEASCLSSPDSVHPLSSFILSTGYARGLASEGDLMV